ncbi:MAG: hypothetical protein JXB33_03950 [Clostridia bacterium]|nr:hypothetical protein [Clostridia bacterium]
MSRLKDCIGEYNSIAVAGMCKNAGKTTVVNHIVREYCNTHKIGLTSIGYDGEEFDEITRLEKPRINVYPGMLVATCTSCLEKAGSGYRIIQCTGINTVLGEIQIAEVVSRGFLEVSGPSLVSQIEELCNSFRKLGCDKVIVDGSAGRLSFASQLDCMILAVGGALGPSMTSVVKNAKYQVELLDILECRHNPFHETNDSGGHETNERENPVTVVFDGAVTDDDLIEIMRKNKGHRKLVVVNNSASLFLSQKIYRKFLNKNGEICVRQKTNLVAIAINPMSPYGKWFSKEEFLKEMRSNINIPVINVLEEEASIEQ